MEGKTIFEKRMNAVKKRFLSAISFILMMTVILCAVSYAEPGENGSGSGTHECNGIVFRIPLQGELRDALPAGNYYLTGDCYAVNRIYISEEVNICLNGFIFETQGNSTLQVTDGGTLSLYDCSGEGSLGAKERRKKNHPLTIDAGGTVNAYAVDINSNGGPAAVDNVGTFNMYGGTVRCGGEIMEGNGIKNRGVVNLYGGEITAKKIGIIMRNEGTGCNILSGDTIVSAGENAFYYTSDTRPVSILEEEGPGWRTDAADSFRYSGLPKQSQLQKTVYFEVQYPDSGEDSPVTEETDMHQQETDLQESAGADADVSEPRPEDAVMSEPEPEAPQHAAAESPSEENVMASPDTGAAGQVTEWNRTESSLPEETSENALVYVVFGLIAAASLAVIVCSAVAIRRKR